MKATHFIKNISLLVVSFLLLSACEDTVNNNLSQVYKVGETTADNIITAYYKAANDINFTSAYQQEFAELLSGSGIDSVDVEPVDLVEDLNKKVSVFSAYEDLMLDLQNKNNDPNSNMFKTKVSVVLNNIDSLNNEDLSEQTAKIRSYMSGYQFDKNVVLAELTDLLYSIWSKDVQNWVLTLNKSYNLYSLTVDKIPSSVFDEKKLEKYVYEPYKDKETLVKVYKLNLKQEAYAQKTKFIDKITTLETIFGQVRSLYSDIAGGNAGPSRTTYMTEHLLNQLEAFNEK